MCTFEHKLGAVECPIDLINQMVVWSLVSSSESRWGCGYYIEVNMKYF